MTEVSPVPVQPGQQAFGGGDEVDHRGQQIVGKPPWGSALRLAASAAAGNKVLQVLGWSAEFVSQSPHALRLQSWVLHKQKSRVAKWEPAWIQIRPLFCQHTNHLIMRWGVRINYKYDTVTHLENHNYTWDEEGKASKYYCTVFCLLNINDNLNLWACQVLLLRRRSIVLHKWAILLLEEYSTN